MKDEDKNLETLDFDSDDNIETLSLDEEVSNKIDEMLDFFDDSIKKNKKEEEKKLDELLENVSNEKKLEIDVKESKLDEYVPSIKDFNIKSLKTKKIVKKVMLYTIIVMLFCFEFFLTKTGQILNNLRVYASDAKPIRITQNNKYGYIDYTGEVLSNPKYDYAEEFNSNYAIVKNSSNLPLIIDKGSKEVVKQGKYFSLNRTGSNIVASKLAKDGLKYGILNADLKVISDFDYDTIDYYDDVYTYVKENTVGLINKNGKEIYKYKLTDNVDKSINIYPSKLTSTSADKYAALSINSSFQIINLKSGKEITKPTLNKIKALDNNVFEETTNSGKTYIYVYNDSVVLETNDYKSISVLSIDTGVILGLKDASYDLISAKTKDIIKKDITDDNFYYGDSVFMYKDYDYKKGKNVIYMIKDGEVYNSLYADFEIYKPFLNKVAIVKYADNTYGYIDTNGNLISDKHYTIANDFDKYGEAICGTEEGLGVINKNGKIIISFENKDIKMASYDAKKKSSGNINNIFYAVKKDNRYALYNKKGNKYNDKYYNDVIFDETYPILKVSSNTNDQIIIPENKRQINITSFNTKYEAYENYIIIKNEYYNYKGKLIYTDRSYKESDGA